MKDRDNIGSVNTQQDFILHCILYTRFNYQDFI